VHKQTNTMSSNIFTFLCT